ncbi:MAG: hypothetical protein ACK6CE_00645 [Planctomycetota bacterium]
MNLPSAAEVFASASQGQTGQVQGAKETATVAVLGDRSGGPGAAPAATLSPFGSPAEERHNCAVMSWHSVLMRTAWNIKP